MTLLAGLFAAWSLGFIVGYTVRNVRRFFDAL